MGFEGSINTAQINNVGQTVQSGKVKVLQEGSSVRVVIIADKGNGKYQGAVAGVRVNITSKNPMAVGSSFIATVSSKNGVIHLTPQNQNTNIFSQFTFEQSLNQFNQYLLSFGLPQDSLSNTIMFQLKQLGMQFDADLIRKIYSLASKFGDKEKIAASLISILEEKGLDVTEIEIEKMIQELDLEDTNKSFDKDGNNRREKNLSDECIYAELKEFINKLANIDSDKIGLITISNHIKRVGSYAGNWIFIPYEIVDGSKMETLIGRGNIKINITDSKNLNKILLEYFNGETFRFLMNFENAKLKKVKMNISNLSDDLINKKISALSKKLGMEVEYFLEEELENTAALSEPLYSVGGLI